MALQELKVLVQALAKEGVQVGIHCCSNTDWSSVLKLPIHYLSIDAALSLGSLLSHEEALKAFLKNGGRLSLGVVPTGRSSILHSMDVPALFEQMMSEFGSLGGELDLLQKVLDEAIYTPACGLALQSVSEAELILESLSKFATCVRERRDEKRHGSSQTN